MPRREESLASMRDALQLMDPSWDIVPGTAEYKILEAVAQQIENLTFNSVLNDYHFDVDKKSGLELDVFMALFGFARIKAKRATGEVTFSRGTEALQDYVVSAGTQVFVPATEFNPSIFFQTSVGAVLPSGSTEVSIPVQGVVAGTIGNVGSATVTGLATATGGITAVNNAQPISGGRDSETDVDLRERWRRTVFRNISGTEDQFLAMAFNESAFISRANVVGPVERYREQIQLSAPEDLTTTSPWETTLDAGSVSNGADTSWTVVDGTVFPVADPGDSATAFYLGVWDAGSWLEVVKVTTRVAGSNNLTVVRSATGAQYVSKTVRQVFPSSVPDSAFTYSPGGEVVGLDISLSTQQVGRRGTDYELITAATNGVAPGVVLPALYVYVVGADTFGLDAVVEMEHEYTPIASRNDPDGARFSNGSTADKVDMFVDGIDELTVAEQFPMRQDRIFNSNVTIADYLRDDGVNTPAAGNYFTQLSKAPVTDVPDSIAVPATATSAATTYYKNEDYWLVIDQTATDGSPRAADGLEWRVPGATQTGVFAATVAGGVGKLTGWYAYVVTYEIDGVETLADTDTPESPSGANNTATFGKNNLTVPVWAGGGTVKWRRIYRSVGSATQAAALAGPFYLLTVIKNNSAVAYEDNKRDDALGVAQPPQAAPPVDSTVLVEYNYNKLIERLDASVDLVRLVGMDTLAHAAEEIQLKFNLAVVLVPGMSVEDVKADINTQLQTWMSRKFFLNNVQLSDLVDTVKNAVGVDNVRLVHESERRNDVQKVTVVYTASPDADRDQFTLTIGGVVSGAIEYNESMGTVREILEAMPNIQEGNTYATVINGNHTDTDVTILVNDSASLHVGYASLTDPVLEDYWIQVGNEILYVESVSDLGANLELTVKRAQLGTSAVAGASSLPSLADVHVLGDVAVVRTAATLTSIYTIHFLPNLYSGVNDWGYREVPLVTAAKLATPARLTFAVAKRTIGVGDGIQQVAPNDQTVVATYSDDFYLASDELPALFEVDLLLRAQNTF